jgi:hypothetical protein
MSKKKTKLLTMKVDEAEKEKWQKLATSYNMSLSELIRNRLNNLEMPPQPKKRKIKIPKVDPELIRQVAAIGNNLNQIARRVNQGEKFDIVIELRSIEIQLERLINANTIR